LKSRGDVMMGRKVVPALFVLLLLLPAFSQTEQTYRIKKVGKSPNFLALSADGKRLYATSFGTDEFLEIDLSKRMIERRVSVGGSPLSFALAEKDGVALVACKDAGIVAVVSLDNFQVVGDVNVGGYPNSVTISPLGYRAYVTDYGRSREGSLHIIDIRNRRKTATIKMGASPFASTVSPVTELIYVVMGGDNEVWVVDPERQAIVKKIAVGEAPDGIAITPDGSRVFVANSRSNDLSVIDTQMMRILVTIPVGKMPFGVDVSPDGKRIFVVNSASRNVSVIPADLSSLEGVTFPVDKGPTDIAVGRDNRTVYVVNELSNSIVVSDVP
jgi:YVTN family beta-propeller protein